jgi:hypothetical protein
MRNAYFQRRKALVEDSREVQSSDNADLYTLEPEPEPLEPESR